ncbi:hypothetical protein SAMN04489715_0996 [Schaalia meyeri]|nr:hypothetical protein SAMN04489715_0996 [Schaalia meyeri]
MAAVFARRSLVTAIDIDSWVVFGVVIIVSTIVDGAVVIAADVTRSGHTAGLTITDSAVIPVIAIRRTVTPSSSTCGRLIAATAAAPAGSLALLANLLRVASQIAASRRQHGENCLKGFEGVGEDLQDRPDARRPLRDLRGDLCCRNRRRGTKRHKDFCNHLEAGHNDVRNRADDGIVNVVNRVGDFVQSLTECARCFSNRTNRTHNDRLALKIGANRLTPHVRHGAL